MLGGGAGSINLNGEYYSGNETGGINTQNYIVPQKKVLREFMYSLDFTRMYRFTDYSGTPPDAFSNALAENGKQYALYLFHGAYEGEWGAHFMLKPGNWNDTLTLNDVSAGDYLVEWIDPASGAVKGSEHLSRPGGNLQLITPSYSIDIALRISRDK
jgi:hypothetical protein